MSDSKFELKTEILFLEITFYILRIFSLRRDETIDGRVNNDCRNSESVELNFNEYDEDLSVE